MLRSLRKLSGFRLQTANGGSGKPRNWLFDASLWAVRYLVAEIGFWPTHHPVLVRPSAFREIEEALCVLVLDDTNRGLETDGPGETDLGESWRYGQDCSPGLGRIWEGRGGTTSQGALAKGMRDIGAACRARGDPHAFSWREVLRCRICTGQEEIGHMNDFIVEDRSWMILYMVISVGHWGIPKQFVVVPDWIDGVNWESGLFRVKVAKQLIYDAPRFIPSLLCKREYEEELFGLYYAPTA